MWRTEKDPRTIARYKIREKYDNVARTAAAWWDEFMPKFRGGDTPKVDVSKTFQLQKRLGCKPFAHFLHRFRKALARHGACYRDRLSLEVSKIIITTTIIYDHHVISTSLACVSDSMCVHRSAFPTTPSASVETYMSVYKVI